VNRRHILVGVSLSTLLLASVVAGAVMVSGRNARIASLRQELQTFNNRQQETSKNLRKTEADLRKTEADLRASQVAGESQTAKFKKERTNLYSWDELEPCVEAANHADSFASMMSYATTIEPVTLARFAAAKRLCDKLSDKHYQAQGKEADAGD
jgi:septal ring factor EnvC (AmiA/AmiB activator)